MCIRDSAARSRSRSDDRPFDARCNLPAAGKLRSSSHEAPVLAGQRVPSLPAAYGHCKTSMEQASASATEVVHPDDCAERSAMTTGARRSRRRVLPAATRPGSSDQRDRICGTCVRRLTLALFTGIGRAHRHSNQRLGRWFQPAGRHIGGPCIDYAT